MTALVWLMGLAFSMFLQGILTAVTAQDAILPQGDTRLQTVEQESPHAREARNERLRQQGEGSSYRVEGVSQLVADTGATSQENTGLSDPSVNPGQAAGTKTFRGRVLKSENNIHTIQLRNGKQAKNRDRCEYHRRQRCAGRRPYFGQINTAGTSHHHPH